MTERGQGEIKTIGLLLDFFNPKILEGANAYLEQHEIKLDARWSVRGDWSPENPEWDGVIYGIIDNDQLLRRIKQWKMPRVTLLVENNEEWMVTPDFVQCGMAAAKELVEAGAECLLTANTAYKMIDKQFAQGVSRYTKANSIPCHELNASPTNISKMHDSLVEYIQNSPQKLGFCQPHAGVAYSLQNTLIKIGIRIPETLSMVVIEKDIQLTPLLATVPLTTIELNEWHRGFVAAEMIHRLLIDDPLPQKHNKIPLKGVTRRASTGHEVVKDRVASIALNYVRNNYLKPIGVADVVSAVGVSRRVVEMRFREILNRGVHEELTRLRIEEAKRLISSKNSTVTSIAETCGFSSVHYFSTAFKRETGISPKQFQKQGN